MSNKEVNVICACFRGGTVEAEKRQRRGREEAEWRQSGGRVEAEWRQLGAND